MIIGLAGKAGAGKDTAAEFLVSTYGFRQLALADNLKTLCKFVFQISHAQCYDQKLKEKKFANPILLSPKHIEGIVDFATRINGFEIDTVDVHRMYLYVGQLTVFKTPRELLQFVGTELLRDIVDIDYHLKVAKNKIDEGTENTMYVITDARFDNERQMIKKWGGITALVDRKTVDREVGLSNHASENSLSAKDNYDFVIDNSGDIDDLAKEVDKLVTNINNL